MDLLLIRHGQSEANEKGLLISNSSDGLTVTGEKQSERLSALIKRKPFVPDLVYSSPWQRAKATTVQVFPQQQDNIIYEPRLAETNPGIYGSWQETEFNRQFPNFYDDLSNQYEGGESHMDMASRVIEWLKQMIEPRQDVEGLLAVVAHGGPISVMLQYLLGMPIEARYPSFIVPNASYSSLIWRKDLQRYCAVSVGVQPE